MRGDRCNLSSDGLADRSVAVAFRLVPVFLLVVAIACGCRDSAAAVDADLPAGRLGIRDVRVRVAVSEADVRVGVRGAYLIRTATGEVLERGTDLPWTLVSGGDEVVLGSRPPEDSGLEIVPELGGVVTLAVGDGGGWSDARRYRGYLRLRAVGDKVQIINVVDVESYLAGVLPGEIYGDFHEQAFLAQAIAARTYCLYEMSTRSGSAYDVTATEASQVYLGMADSAIHRKARAAVESTRGVVCTWTAEEGERVFCTYFCSACGGITRSVENGPGAGAIPPLAGGVRCNYCGIAKGEAYRWKPRSVTLDELTDRVESRYPEAVELGNVVDLRVVYSASTGHVESVSLIGETGDSMELSGERFRLTVGSRVMRSGSCRVRVDGDSIVFEDGRGFGHGMGLCQWGMEGQARLGRTAAQILRHYYPQANLTRAY